MTKNQISIFLIILGLYAYSWGADPAESNSVVTVSDFLGSYEIIEGFGGELSFFPDSTYEEGFYTIPTIITDDEGNEIGRADGWNHATKGTWVIKNKTELFLRCGGSVRRFKVDSKNGLIIISSLGETDPQTYRKKPKSQQAVSGNVD